jgi:hypothetical protein
LTPLGTVNPVSCAVGNTRDTFSSSMWMFKL